MVDYETMVKLTKKAYKRDYSKHIEDIDRILVKAGDRGEEWAKIPIDLMNGPDRKFIENHYKGKGFKVRLSVDVDRVGTVCSEDLIISWKKSFLSRIFNKQ